MKNYKVCLNDNEMEILNGYLKGAIADEMNPHTEETLKVILEKIKFMNVKLTNMN